MKTKIILMLVFFSFLGIKAQEKSKISELKKMPSITQRVIPAYPEEAKKLGVTAKVILEINIDEKGNVTDATVVTCNLQGREGSSLDEQSSIKLKDVFDQPAIDAAKKMKFSPGIDKSGKAVKSKVMLPFAFNLDSKKK